MIVTVHRTGVHYNKDPRPDVDALISRSLPGCRGLKFPKPQRL